MKSAIDEGISPQSAHACASVAAMPSLTSRDQPSAVLKATMRTGDGYWPSSRWRIIVRRSVWATSVSGQAKPSLAINETAMKRWLANQIENQIDNQNRSFRRLMITLAILIAVLQVGALGLLVKAFLL